jgi:hypothetical protein
LALKFNSKLNLACLIQQGNREFWRLPKIFQKDVAIIFPFDIVLAPRLPKGWPDSIVCEPITDFPAGTGLMAR